MRIGICITARLGSSRLPRKHLQPCAGKPALVWLLERVKHEFSAELASGDAAIVITTTPEAENDAFTDFGVTVFRGSKENIPLRHLETAKQYGFNGIVSVDGDDILCAPEAIRAVHDALRAGASGVKTEGLPFGMNAWGYSLQTLEKSLQGHAHDALETGWGRIFDFATFKTVSYIVGGNDDSLRLTLDYQEDLALFDAILRVMGREAVTAAAPRIVRVILDNGFQLLNKKRVEEYWNNFHSEKAKEQRESDEQRTKTLAGSTATHPHGQPASVQKS